MQNSDASDPRIGFFDNLAEQWDVSGQSPNETVETVKQHANRLGLLPGHCVLEVGCGTGQLTGWLAEQVHPGRVVGIDFSSKMLRKAESKGIAASFRMADVCQNDLGEAEFDVALCFHSFPHFRDQPAALRNLARCLTPGGRLIVMHLHSRDEINKFHHHVGGTVGHDLLPNDQQWIDWLNAAGFDKPDITDGDSGFMLQASLRR